MKENNSFEEFLWGLLTFFVIVAGTWIFLDAFYPVISGADHTFVLDLAVGLLTLLCGLIFSVWR